MTHPPVAQHVVNSQGFNGKLPMEMVPTACTKYKNGDLVEYFSADRQDWVPAKVTGVQPTTGNLDLDCRKDVAVEKVRSIGGDLDATKKDISGGGGGIDTTLNAVAHTAGPTGPFMQTAPVQLLQVKRENGRWWYEVCPEGAKILERHGERPIAVVSICGLYRTGKSYLLNLLTERVQQGLPLFQVGATTRVCTEGLWLWGSGEWGDDPHVPLLAFLDCEGFGNTDSDRNRDAQLMTLCALLSSVLVLNTKGNLNETLFNALALTCRFAEHIEERGNEASRPALYWVLRDFTLDLVDESGLPITPDQYLEQALRSAPQPGFEGQRNEAGLQVRQSLLRFFGQRHCTTIPRPVIEEAKLQQLELLPYATLRNEFRTEVEGLRNQLKSLSRANLKAVGRERLGCSSFVALMRQLVNAVNENTVISVKGAWDSVQHTACGALTDELRDKVCKLYRGLASGQPAFASATLPLTDEALFQLFESQRHELKVQWDERAVGDEAVRKEYWQELMEVIGAEESALKQQNVRIGEKQLREALSQWQAWLDDPNGTWEVGEKIYRRLSGLMERMPGSPLKEASKVAIEKAGQKLAAARDLALAERHELETKLDQTRIEADMQVREIKRERDELRNDNSRIRSEQLTLLAETERRLSNDHKNTNAKIEGQTTLLMDSERNAGRLEGQVHALSSQAKLLREQLEDMESRVREKDAEKGAAAQEKEKFRRELEEAHALSARLQAEAEIAQRKLDAEKSRRIVEETAIDRQPKCGCIVQ